MPNPLRVARERAGLTREKLCAEAGVSYHTLQNAERGLATERTIVRVAAVLGVSADALRVVSVPAPGEPEPAAEPGRGEP